MSNRTTDCYTSVFNYIENEVFKLEPAGLMTDWEAAMRNALRIRYPNSKLRGCWWHHRHAVRRKCRNLGLHDLFKYNSDARMIKQQLLSLSLLPHESFTEGYNYIKNLTNRCKLSKDLKGLFSYYERFWIEEVWISR